MGKNDGKRMFGGIDIGGTKILAVVAAEDGAILAASKKKVREHTGKSVLQRAADAMTEAIQTAGVDPAALTAVGTGLPSPVTPDGVAVAAVNLGWKNEPVTQQLQKLIGLPVFAANDCNAGTYGEYVYGAGKGSKTLVGYFMGTGLV